MKDSAEQKEVPRKNGNDGFDELRRLLLAPEQQQIDQLEERLESASIRADRVSDVLPDAIRIRQSQDKQLTQSLMPSIQEAIRVSIKKDPRVLADALFPIMGPAIRKAIAAALSGMIQSLKQDSRIQPFTERIEMAMGSASHRKILCRNRADSYAVVPRGTGFPHSQIHRLAVAAYYRQFRCSAGRDSCFRNADSDPGFCA